MRYSQISAMAAWARASALAGALLFLAVPAQAQGTVSSNDIQRLQDEVYQASSDVSRLRATNQNEASRLQTDLDDLRDEVVYLKVKMRKEGSLRWNEYADVRDRVQELRSRARGENTWNSNNSRPSSGTYGGTNSGTYGGTSGGTSGGTVYQDQGTRPSSQSSIPTGQEIDVRLQTELSSGTAQPEDHFEATTVVDLYQGNNVLIPAGSVMRGVVRTVDKATRTDRKGEMTVAFDQVTIRGRNYPMRGTVTQAIESEGIKGEAAKIGTAGAVGAIIGGIIGGAKGALLGVLIGGGGTIAATPGKDVTLPAGTVLRVRLDTPPAVR